MELFFNPIRNKLTPDQISKNDILVLLIREFKSNHVVNYNTILELEVIDDMPQSTALEKNAFTQELSSLINRHSEDAAIKKEEQSLITPQADISGEDNNDSHQEELQPIKLIF